MKLTKQRLHLNFNPGILACGIILFVGLFQNAFAQEPKLKDNAIKNAIEADLWMDDVVDMNTIDLSVNSGIVTFTGTANNILVTDRIVDIAENIKGVRSIINRIQVNSKPPRSDMEIQRDVTQALFADPASDSYEVSATVENGKVTLTGKVQSWAEKQICEDVAKGVKGVRKIKDDIVLEYKTDRSDYEIEQDIKGRLANDVRVLDALLDVKVKDGNVALSGVVGSLREKGRAISDAWVSGVNSVNTDGMMIQWWARDRMLRDKQAIRSDKEIKAAVRDAFVYDPRIFSFNPEVEVNFGTVTLSGVVDNYLAKKAAEQDAKNTVGVLMVQNQLKVRPLDLPTDEQLKKRIEGALTKDPYINRFALNIDTFNGIVYLTGDVNTSFEKSHAESVVQKVKGVTDIVSNIQYDYQWKWKPDWELKKDVQQQLDWSVFVNEDQIDVEVDQGIVTLSGDVSTWIDYNAAEKNAYEAGAKDVKNKLVVLNNNYGPFYYWGALH